MLTATRYYVRPMTEADISQVADIEGESFPTTWPRTAYKRELSNRLARYLVLVDRTQNVQPPAKKPRRFSLGPFFRSREEAEPTTDYVVGYVGIWLMVDEAHIVAIAIRESYRRKGIGETLLLAAIDLALENQQESMTLEVRRSNYPAQALYEKYRFLKVGVRKRYYSDNHEDALIMSTPPIQDESYRELLAYHKDRLLKRLGESSAD
jgi:ribosomal-protein-alanine N-acetyltransferase